MSIVRHALSPRWLSYLALAVVFAVITTLFGLWQWDRRGEAVAEIERVEANFDAAAVGFYELLPQGSNWSDELRWRPVVVRGEYLVEKTLLVRTRPRFGQVGFEILIPFRTSTGEVVLVNRGWVPTGADQDAPDLIPPAPNGSVSVLARVFAGEPTIPGRSAPEGQVATIHLPTIAEITGEPVDQRAYLALTEEDPASVPTPLLVERPAADEGPHLSYSVQWFLFGALGFVAWGYLLRDDYRRSAGLVDKPVKPKAASDQDIEDDILDRIDQSR